MNLTSLIDAAKQKKGSLGAVAQEMEMDQTRLSDWKAGRRKPDASEIAYLAEVAGLPVLETVATIETQLNHKYANVWQKAIRELRGELTISPYFQTPA